MPPLRLLRCNAPPPQVSPTALREGAIIDSLTSIMPSFRSFTDVRKESVAHVAERFDVEDRYESAKHSSALAEALLVGLRAHASADSPVHDIHHRDADLLLAGVLLHQVGLFVGHQGNHKHAYYIIKNTDLLLGFTPLEVAIVALLVRYHRKKPPQPTKEAEIKRLSPELRPKVPRASQTTSLLDTPRRGRVSPQIRSYASLLWYAFPPMQRRQGL